MPDLINDGLVPTLERVLRVFTKPPQITLNTEDDNSYIDIGGGLLTVTVSSLEVKSLVGTTSVPAYRLERTFAGPGNDYGIDPHIDVVEIGRYRDLPQLISALIHEYASFLVEIVWDELVAEALVRDYKIDFRGLFSEEAGNNEN